MSIKVPYGRLIQYAIASGLDFPATRDLLAKDFELPVVEEIYNSYAEMGEMKDEGYCDELRYYVDSNYMFVCGLALGFDSMTMLYTFIAIFAHPQISRADAFSYLRERFAVDLSSREKLVDLIYDYSGWGPEDYMLYIRFLESAGVPKEIIETYRNARFERKEWVEHRMNVGNMPPTKRLELMVAYMMPSICDKMMSGRVLDSEIGNAQMKTLLKAMEITEGEKGLSSPGMTVLEWQARLKVVTERVVFPSITDPKFAALTEGAKEGKK